VWDWQRVRQCVDGPRTNTIAVTATGSWSIYSLGGQLDSDQGLTRPYVPYFGADISCLKRAYGLARCTWRGLGHFRAYVWSAVVAYNLALAPPQTRLTSSATPTERWRISGPPPTPQPPGLHPKSTSCPAGATAARLQPLVLC